jgi:hypothetical protein
VTDLAGRSPVNAECNIEHPTTAPLVAAMFQHWVVVASVTVNTTACVTGCCRAGLCRSAGGGNGAVAMLEIIELPAR